MKSLLSTCPSKSLLSLHLALEFSLEISRNLHSLLTFLLISLYTFLMQALLPPMRAFQGDRFSAFRSDPLHITLSVCQKFLEQKAVVLAIFFRPPKGNRKRTSKTTSSKHCGWIRLQHCQSNHYSTIRPRKLMGA